ncbi:MAG: glycosyltransferase family 2 protein [Muribaculaceae bacterium]|nr:glycosyltransferase family 2 protein [Muribaculaceae bacterium]
MSPVITIIIPHKNSSKLLNRLLVSIPKHEDWQVIVVDDHSSEEECNAVKQLCKSFDFECYDNPYTTAGGARNKALEHAKGKWILFADADDYFTTELYEAISRNVNSEADIVFFSAISKDSDTGEEAFRNEHIVEMINKYHTTADDGYLRYKLLAPISKLIRHELITDNNIKFEERPAGNDMWFSINTGIAARKVECDNTAIYCITIRKGSITTTISPNLFEHRLQASIRTNKLLRKHKLNKYQISLLYFLGMSYQFGLKYMLHVAKCVLFSGTSLLIGLNKILKINKVLNDRQNRAKLTRVKN